MIARLKGVLSIKRPDHLVVDVSGVGYRVFVPLSTFYELPASGGEVALIIHTHVSDDCIHLYGFKTDGEKEIFELLLAVTGIGPRLAMNILSGIQALELSQALGSGDADRLRAVPGVGKKLAERMIVELRDKVPGLAGLKPPPVVPVSDEEEAMMSDALSAMINLGYNRIQAQRALVAAMKNLSGEPSLEELLKKALKGLAR